MDIKTAIETKEDSCLSWIWRVMSWLDSYQVVSNSTKLQAAAVSSDDWMQKVVVVSLAVEHLDFDSRFTKSVKNYCYFKLHRSSSDFKSNSY